MGFGRRQERHFHAASRTSGVWAGTVIKGIPEASRPIQGIAQVYVMQGRAPP